MKIDENKLKLGIWCEDENGNYLGNNGDSVDPVKGAHTYHSCYPLEVTEHIYISHSAEEKATCKHRRKYLKKDNGLIKGLKGRSCTLCGCYQKRKWWQPWGRKWDNGANITPLMDCHFSIGRGNEKIILSMANSGDYTLSEAIAVYASSCERCANVLAWKYTNGQDGYEEYEKLVDVIPNLQDTPEARKTIVLIHWNNFIPYSYRAMIHKLDSFCGVNNYDISGNLKNYELMIKTHFSTITQIAELEKMLDKMLPMTMVPAMFNELEYELIGYVCLHGVTIEAKEVIIYSE